jgi:hypothetical protein
MHACEHNRDAYERQSSIFKLLPGLFHLLGFSLFAGHLLPGMADSLFEFLPCSFVGGTSFASRLGFDGLPILASIIADRRLGFDRMCIRNHHS